MWLKIFPVHWIYLDIYLSVLAVLDEDEQTLINVNIVDKEKVRPMPMIKHILLNSLIPDLFFSSSQSRVKNNFVLVKFHPFIKMVTHNMTCIRNQHNMRSDWLILGYYSSVRPTGQIRVSKNQAKIHIHVTSNLKHSVFPGKSPTLALPCWPHYCSVNAARCKIFL